MSSPPITPEQLSALPAELRALLQAVIDYYEAKIAELESRLGKTPRNSSLPPSSVHPHAKPPQRKPKSKQQRGGQPGHPKHERPLIPPDECDAVESLRPTECRRCGGGATPLRCGSRSGNCRRSSRTSPNTSVTD